jgi:WD40 repeat protein
VIKKSSHLPFPSPQHLEVSWSTDGSFLYVAGEQELIVLKKSDKFESLTFSKTIRHDKEICMVHRLSKDGLHLVTVGLDKVLKVWTLENESDIGNANATVTLNYKMNLSHELLSLQYC